MSILKGSILWYAKEGEETRKLQFTGGSTYIVSLPKSWITQNQLKRGSMIRLREEEGGLLSIVPTTFTNQNSDEASIRVMPKDRPEAVIRKTVSTYLAGYNKIHLRADKEHVLSGEQRHSIGDFVHKMFVGTEIVTNTPTELTLQVLLSYPELSIQSALGRMGVMASSMHKDAIAALRQHDNALAKSVTSTDNEVDRFNLYVVRQLKTAIQNPRIVKEIGLTSARDCLGYRLVAKSVERTADHAVEIAENVMAMKHKLSAEITEKIDEMSSIAISMFEIALESLSRKDFALAETMIERVNDVIALEKKAVISCKIDGEDEGNLRLIIESIRRTAEYSSDIAEVVLNLTVETIIE